jgi:hypothetical protein
MGRRGSLCPPLGPGCLGLNSLAGLWFGECEVCSLALSEGHLLWRGSRFRVRQRSGRAVGDRAEPPAPNPRCSRRQDLGRSAGWGWGVGEEPVSVVLVRAAELKPLGVPFVKVQ